MLAAFSLTGPATVTRVETFTYTSGHVNTVTSASGRPLLDHIVRVTHPHVTSVVTPDGTPGNSATAQTWTYNHSGDLTQTLYLDGHPVRHDPGGRHGQQLRGDRVHRRELAG